MFNILRLLGLKPNKEQKAETQDSSARHIANANVACRFHFVPRVGLHFISKLCILFKVSLETELKISVRWLQYNYWYSPISRSQLRLLPKRWKLFCLRFWNSPISLLVPVILGIVLSLVILYLSKLYRLK